VDQARYITESSPGVFYCHICKKVATESHIASGPHLNAMEEVAISDLMGGQTSDGYRRHGNMCTGCPTKKMIMEFWGQAITWLPEEGRKVHNAKEAFYINAKPKAPLYPAQATYELGIVSYTGAGKYQHSTYIPYHDLPDCEETATFEELQRTSPPGQGWWPVLSLGEELDKTHGRSVLLVCFYQLQWKEAIVPVWRIWPDWAEPAPKAKAMPQSGAPKAKAMPQSGAASSTDSSLVFGELPRGVWADEEMDASASASASASNLCLRLRGATAVPTAVPPPPPTTRPWAEEEDDLIEIDDVSED
jgi:hypothetical protein